VEPLLVVMVAVAAAAVVVVVAAEVQGAAPHQNRPGSRVSPVAD